MAATHLIGVDWGSTHVRAFRFDAAGGIVETRRGERGAAGLARTAYEGVLRDLLGDWLDATPDKIIICGMAGSREGWIEAPYLECPCVLSTLSQALVKPSSALPAFIVPGLSTRGADGVHDVLRGEETQILGAQPPSDAWVITPGTHSKWAEFADGRLVRFDTYMTGELFRVLGAHSALARTIDMNAALDDDAFARGAARALEGGALSRLAFAVRADSLLASLSVQAAKSYLSGLLIGAEIADALRRTLHARLVLVGANDITELYQRALTIAGIHDLTRVDGEAAAARGLWRIAQGICAA